MSWYAAALLLTSALVVAPAVATAVPAGYVLTLTPSPQWWLASIFTAIGAAVGETAVPVARTLIGQDGWFTSR